jgi:hypothetical protein
MRTRQLEPNALGEKSLRTTERRTSGKTAGAQSQNLSSTKKISQDNPAADKKQEQKNVGRKNPAHLSADNKRGEEIETCQQ